ncbi:Uncharacterized protein SCF082_LOCUS12189 [Durusdinium trenchii]|uniref:Uncharacterized protein n=1 Tax=Durusdinium trenchii TaxID=1381693 RepID=A0ABP0JI28_9DINO
MSFNMDASSRSYRNLTLSYRGSERQSPNCLQLALRFSRIMEAKAAEHPPGTSTVDRLNAVIAEFHNSPGLSAKHRLDEDKQRSVFNVLAGTCSEARHILQRHIDHVKWAHCAFSAEQLRGNRWMIGATPKAGCPPALKKALTVTEQSQAMHFRLTIHCFIEGGRRLRASSRSRLRWASQQFDVHADLACMYSAVLDEARELSSWTDQKEQVLMKAFYSKDYMPEVEAAVTAKLGTWKLQHLGIWHDLVEPPATPVKITTASELMELEDEAQSARFREVRAKLAQDTAAMCQYNSQKEEVTRRNHVVKVMHEKSQLEIGKQLCESHMERCCRVSLMVEKHGMDPKLDNVYRSVTPLEVDTVLYMDCTKRLEDKFTNHKIELRPWTLNINLDELHKNRELPGAFGCFLGVADSTLPLRGTAHRSVRGAPEAENQVNVFCGSFLWTRQALMEFPSAIQEKDFTVPGDAMLSHTERRNLTDFQETSQWLGGPAVPKAVLKALLSGVKNNFTTVVIHPTAYDGSLEIAALQSGHWTVGTSTTDIHYKAARDSVKNHLLQAWKTGTAPMDKQQQRYKKDVPADDMPKAPSVPELKLCTHNEGRLSIPTDVRKHFIQCAIHGPEWRDILVQFDKDWGAPVAGTPNGSPIAPVPIKNETANNGSPGETPKVEPKVEPDFEWANTFKESPATFAELKNKFGDELNELAGLASTSSFFLAPGPQLYLVAKEPIHLKCMEGALISYGAGSWLTGEKATKFESNSPDRAIPCKLSSDQVQQGKAADAFVVQPDTTNPLVWRPQAVQQKALKPANLASQFAYPLINASPLVLVWRMRLYPSEKVVACAKPLWFLPADLKLGKDGCQRLI